MKRHAGLLIPLTIAWLSLGGNAHAADDARLRETLRSLTLRLRSAETERNNLLTEKAEFDQEKKTLTEKVNALTKQAAADKDAIATLTTKSADQEKELAETKQALDKWKAGYE
jgi:peptidoglycan hydrolase CwlO-like protein